MVGSMIRRSVRTRFRNVYCRFDDSAISAPTVLYANHHGWMDGYLMFHLVCKLNIKSVDWIEEFDSFPLFRYVGGMRYTPNEMVQRAKTIRQTIRLMNKEKVSLVIFPEGVMHRPPSILPLGRAIEVIAKKVPGVTFTPVAIRYEQSIHERPEAWLWTGTPHPFSTLQDCHDRLTRQLGCLQTSIAKGESFPVLAKGTLDVNERFDMRRIPKK